MEIIAYTLVGCTHCNTLKELFQRANVSYDEVMVNKDITMTEFRDLYSHITLFPFVVIDNEEVGGLVETAKLFLANGLGNPPRKK